MIFCVSLQALALPGERAVHGQQHGSCASGLSNIALAKSLKVREH